MKFLKHIKIAGMFTLVALLAPGCQDFLEENPKDRVATSNYYKTEQDAISAVNAIYAHLNSQSGDTFGGVYHSNFWITMGLASDEMNNNQAGAVNEEQLSNFAYSPQNGVVFDVWKQHYKAITLANIAIEKIPAIKMDETLRTRLVNEAKFLRALLYFNLVRMFGEIPLLLKVDEPLTPGAAKVDDIYAQIIKDLSDAEALPADQAEGRGRATSGAAKAILAKVYLTRKDWAKSAAKSKEVIDSHKYELWDNFADVFKIQNRGGKEAIFSVGFGDAGGAIIFWEVAQFHVRLLPQALATAKITTNTLGWQVPTNALATAYGAGDERGAVTVFNRFNETVAGTAYNVPFDKYYFRKYWDVTVPGEFTNAQSANDFPVIRYADVLLMYAEALNEVTGGSAEAHTYLNMVRDRAELPDLSGLSQAAFRDAVLQERRLELAAEGHRWFDLVRTGKLETLVPVSKPGVVPQSRYNLFPIPQRERDLNTNLPQNDY
ncbi:RagB/SusD family nutrient uptake outer membrane protein [Fulvivirgaceae bacterium PWU4]|uniref:RagB/SusD family nutrient uptake outer membrane protein n=1 Tax=Chryseosolibacter histidini TaxID=2782349 RepID=A0AAP2DJM9_9BACT|nr:RagB/SusD family nutrient uptake outer membrane protein [Chryseosolibacter histidini]MBT1697591.1 RagB/SusD family nutrient uptake outer membrane protein [Chryseosolibacter histidini]